MRREMMMDIFHGEDKMIYMIYLPESFGIIRERRLNDLHNDLDGKCAVVIIKKFVLSIYL